MPDRRRKNCRECHRHANEAGEMSWEGLCIECARERLSSNIDQMHARSGPNFDRWRRSMALCVGGILLDDLELPT
jgi:hypothetical protein